MTSEHLTTLDQWREWFLTRTAIADDHEMHVYQLVHPSGDVTDTIEAGQTLTLRCMAPHQSDTDLVDIHRQVARDRPGPYADYLIDVRRSDRAGASTPPYIDITLTPGVRADQHRRSPDGTPGPVTYKDWAAWVDGCPMLREFRIILSDVRRDDTGRQVDLYFVGRDGVTSIDLPDMISQLSRITMRLDVTAYADARALVQPRELHDGTPGVIIALRLDTDPDLPAADDDESDDRYNDESSAEHLLTIDPPPAATGDDWPTGRYGWQIAVDKDLVRLYRWVNRGQTPPPGYPENVHRYALWTGVAVAAAGVAILFAMFILATIFKAAQALHSAAGSLAGTGAARTVLGPVHTWLDAHTTGMPFTGGNAFTLWAIVGGACLLLGMARNTGARIGWCLWGAATAWIVWHGTSIGSQEANVGVAGIWWILGSLLAFRRRGGTPHVVAHVPGMAVDRSGNVVSPSTMAARARQLAETARYLVRRHPDKHNGMPSAVINRPRTGAADDRNH